MNGQGNQIAPESDVNYPQVPLPLKEWLQSSALLLYDKDMEIKYPEIGVCGLSCRLCPNYQTEAASRCLGCKSPDRMALGCLFITCAIKKTGVEFCWDCEKNESCEKWKKHREAGKTRDSFKSYQKLESDIEFIAKYSLKAYEEQQKTRESLLRMMLARFNEGRSKSYYCIAVTVLEIDELKDAIDKATAASKTMSLKDKSRLMHTILDHAAAESGYVLRLRK